MIKETSAYIRHFKYNGIDFVEMRDPQNINGFHGYCSHGSDPIDAEKKLFEFIDQIKRERVSTEVKMLIAIDPATGTDKTVYGYLDGQGKYSVKTM